MNILYFNFREVTTLSGTLYRFVVGLAMASACHVRLLRVRAQTGRMIIPTHIPSQVFIVSVERAVIGGIHYFPLGLIQAFE